MLSVLSVRLSAQQTLNNMMSAVELSASLFPLYIKQTIGEMLPLFSL